MIHSYIEPPPLPPPIPLFHFILSFARHRISTHVSLSPCLVNQTTSGDRSCRFPTSQWGANIHPKEWRVAVTPDDIMTAWKLINSFIQPKLLLLFISVTAPPFLSLSISLFSLSYLSQIHPPAPHLFAGAAVTHKSLLLSNAIHFPRNTGWLLQKLGQA